MQVIFFYLKNDKYIINPKYIRDNTIPFILLLLLDLSGTPTAIAINIPPTKPPIWAALSIPELVNPIIKLSTITGIIDLVKVTPRYVL